MNTFPDIEATKFAAALITSVEGRTSPLQKSAAAAALLNLFLDAQSYSNATTETERRERHDVPGYLIPHFAVPYQVFVSVEDDASRPIVGDRPSLQRVQGKHRFPINSKYWLVIDGAQKLFEVQPSLNQLCEFVATYLSRTLGDTNPLQSALTPVSAGSPSAHALASGDPTTASQHLHWSPMSEAYRLLADATEHFHIDRKRLRWAWVSITRHPATQLPYIYLQPTDTKRSPRVMNHDGRAGIIHGVLEKQVPKLLWNYTHNPDWDLAKETKREFILEANAEAFPHMIYFPVLERLAAQITFGPDDDLLNLLRAGTFLVELAPVTLVSGFEKTIFVSLLDLLWNYRSNNGSPDTSEIRRFLTFAADVCPVPAMKVVQRKQGLLRFEPDSHSSPLSRAFAEQANASVQQAYESILKRSETEDYKTFGANIIGMTHTIARPIHNMRSYVETVASQKNLTRHLVKRSTEMLSFLRGVEVIANLEINAFKQVFPTEGGPSPKTNCTADDIFAVLADVNYDPSLSSPNRKLHFSGTISDPIHRAQVIVTQSRNTNYHAPAGPLALIIGELIDNAAKHMHPKGTPIQLHFNPDTVVITNSIQSKPSVEAALNAGRNSLGKSLNRIHHVARMVGFHVDFTFPSINAIKFTIGQTKTP